MAKKGLGVQYASGATRNWVLAGVSAVPVAKSFSNAFTQSPLQTPDTRPFNFLDPRSPPCFSLSSQPTHLRTMKTTPMTYLAVAVLALVLCAATVVSAASLRSGDAPTNWVRLSRLLNESPTCTTGSGTGGASCASGNDCQSGFCHGGPFGASSCGPNCVTDGNIVMNGDDCSCCGVKGVDEEANFGQAYCQAAPA